MPIIRPQIKVLDDDYKRLILEEAKSIIETQGVFIENQQAIAMFDKLGLNHEDKRYFIPSDLVEKCLGTTPHQIKLFDREGGTYGIKRRSGSF